MTANHVVKRDNDLRVGLANGEVVQGQLVGRDPAADIALLKIESSDLSTLTAAAEKEIRVGTLAAALARPGNFVQAALGMVSAVGSSPGSPESGGGGNPFVRTDVLMYPGFSGGPLVAADGKLVGMNSSALMHGASVTLPVHILESIANQLLQHGRVRRAYLGVSTQVVKLQEKIGQELGQRSGLLVVSVEPESPADQAGITIGDTIVKLGSRAIRRHKDLMAELAQAEVDEKIPVAIVRGGELQTVNVKIGEQA